MVKDGGLMENYQIFLKYESKSRKQKIGQYVKLPGHCYKCIFKHKSIGFCIFHLKCMMFGWFRNCTSEDIFKL